MSISRVRSSGSTVMPLGGTGTQTLQTPLSPGLYLVKTDTSQSLSAAQLYFSPSSGEGYRFGAVVRGGQGYVSIPLECNSVTITAGTFPLILEFSKMNYNLISAPTSVSYEYENFSGGGGFYFTPPAGAAGIGVYYTNGTFVDLGAATSPQVVATTPPGGATTQGGGQFPFLLVAHDASGVWGLGANTLSGRYGLVNFNASGTYTVSSAATSVNVAVVGGGGPGGGNTPYGAGGAAGSGGGGGRIVTSNNIPVTPGQTIPITVASAGGTSTFSGPTVVSAGSGGTGATGAAAGGNGAGGGGGGAPAGTGQFGFPGGTSAQQIRNDIYHGGGGGGMTSAGGNAIGQGGQGIIVYGMPMGGGGGGGGNNSPFAPYSRGGGSGAFGGGPVSQAGQANTGGGGGGAQAVWGSGGQAGGAGGTGRVIVKENY